MFCCVVCVCAQSLCSCFLQEFHIQLAESEDDDDQHSETESESANPVHRPPTMDEIDSVLGFFRRDAEV